MRAELRQVLQTDFDVFIARVLKTVDPSASFMPNWHLYLIAQYLEAVRHGRIKRLIINMPPRALKSICVSVAWPAWLLAKKPTARIMAASYASSLSIKHSLDCRLVIQSPWYRNAFPDVRLTHDQNEKHKFITTQRGFRLATSVEGAATGEGGDILIVDDPLNPMQAMSRQMRSAANEWFDHTFSTRLNNKAEGTIVVVMQRLHEDDLTGHLLAKGGWTHLCLPAVATVHESFEFAHVTHPREPGDLLHPARESRELIERAKADLGSAGFAAQYQQQPLPDRGGILRREWLGRYREPPAGEDARITQSWDTGIKGGEGSDPSVCVTFAQQHGSHYVLHVDSARDEYPALRRRMQELAQRWKPETILIEDAASGQSLLQEMRGALPVIGQRPRSDKVTRFAAVVSMIESGALMLPENAPWLADFESELLQFPHVRHDDQVDALSQYLNWMRQKTYDSLQIRRI